MISRANGVGQGDIGADIQRSHTSPSGRVVRRGSIANRRAPLRSPQHVVEEDRVRLARIRAPEQDQVGLLDLAVGARAATDPENRRQTGDAGGVSSAVAAVDVVAPDHRARELLAEKFISLVVLEQLNRPRRWPHDSTADRNPAAARSRASSQVAGRSAPVSRSPSRTSGVVNRAYAFGMRRSPVHGAGAPSAESTARETGARALTRRHAG